MPSGAHTIERIAEGNFCERYGSTI